MPWTYFINDLNDEVTVGTVYKKELKKANQKECGIEKVVEKKDYKLYFKWKGHNYLFDSWINEDDIVQMSKYCSKLKSLGANVKVELDLSNYATKAGLKNAAGVDTLDFAKKN